MTKRWFDATVMVVVLTSIAVNGLLKSWSRKHLTQYGTDSVGGKVAGAVELAA